MTICMIAGRSSFHIDQPSVDSEKRTFHMSHLYQITHPLVKENPGNDERCLMLSLFNTNMNK